MTSNRTCPCHRASWVKGDDAKVDVAGRIGIEHEVEKRHGHGVAPPLTPVESDDGGRREAKDEIETGHTPGKDAHTVRRLDEMPRLLGQMGEVNVAAAPTAIRFMASTHTGSSRKRRASART
ncbi:MAG: hypothetical protein R2854_07230 [Caldilineaceae bacterium]